MLTTRWQPLGTVWPEMNQLQEEIEAFLGVTHSFHRNEGIAR